MNYSVNTSSELPYTVEWNQIISQDKYKNSMIFNWLPYIIDKPGKNARYAEHITAALEADNRSLIQSIDELVYFDAIRNGDIKDWCWEMIYTETMFTLGKYNRNYLYQAYMGAPTKTMTDRMGFLNSKEVEYVISAIAGGKNTTTDFAAFKTMWMNNGGSTITDEVNSLVD